MPTVVKSPRSSLCTILGIAVVACALVSLNVYLWIIATHAGTGAGGPFAFRWVRGLSGWAFERALQESDFLFFHFAALLVVGALVYGLILAVRGRKNATVKAGTS